MKYLLQVSLMVLFVACERYKETPVLEIEGRDNIALFLSKASDEEISCLERNTYNTKAYHLIMQSENHVNQAEQLKSLAKNYYACGNYLKFSRVSKVLLNKSLKNKDSLNLAVAFQYHGLFHLKSLTFDSSYYYYSKAQKINLQLNITQQVIEGFLDIAALQYTVGDVSESQKNIFSALKLLDDSGNQSNEQYKAYALLAAIYGDLREYGKAVDYHNRSLDILWKNNLLDDEAAIPTVIMNIGTVYQNQNQFTKANSYFDSALKIKGLKHDFPRLYATLVDNIAYSDLKSAIGNKSPDKFLESLKIRDSLQDIAGIIKSQIHLSEFYAQTGDTVKAITYSEESYKTTIAHKLPAEALLTLKQLILLNNEKTPFYASEYLRISDSMLQA
ncbi:MAG: tetratricopeptide repeat protein, partial [Nitrosopumilus sp.]|nr:tetratricopeptide repeat protein [Nitrosopumilus sp.]